MRPTFFAATLLLAAQARAVHDLRVGAADAVIVAPGASVDWTVHIVNAGDAASPVVSPFRLYVDPLDVPTGYQFALASGACEHFAPLPGSGDSSGFDVPTIAAGAAIDCTFRVTRAASSVSDVQLTIDQDTSDVSLGKSVHAWAGEPVPLAFTAEKGAAEIAGGRISHTVRLVLHNTGTVGLERVLFGHCVGGETTTITVGFPGACLESSESIDTCFMASRAFTTGAPLLAGQSASCLMRVSEPWPLDAVPGLRLGLEDYAPNTNGGWTGLTGTAQADLGITPVDLAAVPRTVPAVGLAATLLCAVAAVGSALARLSAAARGA